MNSTGSLQAMGCGPNVVDWGNGMTVQCALHHRSSCLLEWAMDGYIMCHSIISSCYLASDLQRVSDLGARRRLRSSTTSALVAPCTVRATIGDRAFPAAAASVWNSLPETVHSSPSLPVFRSRLKTELFARSYSCTD